MPDQPTDAAQWRCGKCDGGGFPLHSPRCPLRQPTDAGRDARTADRLVDDWVADCVAVEAQRSIALALSATREAGRREERVKGLWEAINIAMEETDNSGDCPRIAKAIERRIREVELLAREPREEPR